MPRLVGARSRPASRAVAVLVAAAKVGVGALTVLRHAGSDRRLGLVVLYHRIEPSDGDPARELVPGVGVDAFARELRWLRRLFRVVPAANILDAAAARRRGRRIPVAVTFDDEWPTHVTLALPTLRRAGVRATFFFTGAHLDRVTPFWWEALQHLTDAGIPTRGALGSGDLFAQAARVTTATPAERERASAAVRGLACAGVRSGMAPEDLRRVAGEHDVGFHTKRHDALPTLSREELRRALSEGRDELERVLGQSIRLLAYPHGAAGPREADAASEAGFSLAFTTTAHPCAPDTPPLLIGRVEPGVVSLAGYLRILERCLQTPNAGCA
jgi:peptidoglycan/xylan/chitin deacetylase (PgdA/CDA1 family)